MDYNRIIIEKALKDLEGLFPFLNSQERCNNESSFANEVHIFVKKARFTLEEVRNQLMEKPLKIVHSIGTIGWIVVNYLYSTEFWSLVGGFTRSVRELCGSDVPKYMAGEYEELENILTTTSTKLENIQDECKQLLTQAVDALEGNADPSVTFRTLEAKRLKFSVDLRVCQQRLDSAHEIIKRLDIKVKEMLAKHTVGFFFSAAIAVGCWAGGIIALWKGARTAAGVMGVGALPTTILTGWVADKLLDYIAAYDKLTEKRSEYKEICESLLTTVKKTVEMELKGSAQLLNVGVPADLEEE